jgi:hypothetical protein
MRNHFLVAAVASLAVGLLGCAESAVQQDSERDGEVDFVDGEPDATVPTPVDDDPMARVDAGLRKDAGSVKAGDAGDGGPTPTDAAPQLDSAVRDAGNAVVDSGAPARPDAGVPDAGQPVVDAGPPACASGTMMCGSQCIDTKTSSQNCGACGTVCNNGSTCSNSKCTAPITVPGGCTARVLEGRTYAFCTNARSWRDARRSCIDAKMDLALVGSNAESDFIKANGDSWIAAEDIDKEGTWVAPTLGNAGSNTGPALAFTRWRQGEPSNSQRCDGVDVFVTCLGRRSDEDCALVRSADGQWNDSDCDDAHNYVCEPF